MGKQWKQCQTLFFGAPKSLQMVTAAMKLKDAYSLEVMTKLDSIFRSRDITLLTKVRLVKAMVFPVFMYGCESRTVKKAERWRTDALTLGVDRTKDRQIWWVLKASYLPSRLTTLSCHLCSLLVQAETRESNLYLAFFFFFPLLNLASSHFHRFYWHNFITVSFTQ